MVEQYKAVGWCKPWGLMLNICDSMQQGRQSTLAWDGKCNQRESRSWIHPSEASKDDSAKTHWFYI